MKNIINIDEIISEARTLKLTSYYADPLDIQLIFESGQGYQVIVGHLDSPKHLLYK